MVPVLVLRDGHDTVSLCSAGTQPLAIIMLLGMEIRKVYNYSYHGQSESFSLVWNVFSLHQMPLVRESDFHCFVDVGRSLKIIWKSHIEINKHVDPTP